MARTEPYAIPANQHTASGAWKGRVQFDSLLSSNKNNLSPELRAAPLTCVHFQFPQRTYPTPRAMRYRAEHVIIMSQKSVLLLVFHLAALSANSIGWRKKNTGAEKQTTEVQGHIAITVSRYR